MQGDEILDMKLGFLLRKNKEDYIRTVSDKFPQ